jgi:hypothetical protein
MSATNTRHLRLVILFALLQTNGFSFSQTPSYPVDEWAKKLGEKEAPLASCASVAEKPGKSGFNCFI